MKTREFMAMVAGGLLIATGTATAQSELWRCRQADGSEMFRDHGGPGCHEAELRKDLQRVESSQPPVSPDQPPLDSGQASFPAQPLAKEEGPRLSSKPFPSATRSTPSLVVRDLPAQLKAQGFSLPNKGDIAIVQLTVSHVPEGDGPQLGADFHFQDTARQALVMAVLAAAKGVGYSPKFLRVQLALPAVPFFSRTLQLDGPSAGSAWAVAIASALLGDALRSDVCLTGTISTDLAVGSVGGLEYKIEGCGMLPNLQELILPAGQKTFTVGDKAMARSIKVTEVSTLAEAYQSATGKVLRPMP